MGGGETVLSVEGLSKRFCRDLKRSFYYAAGDILRELAGAPRPAAIRPGEFEAFKDVDFQLRRGEALGLIGANGAGKTTLLKIISGIIKPDAGTVRVRGRVAPLIALGTGFNPALTGRENVHVNTALLGLSRRETLGSFDDIVAFADIGAAIDAPVQTYSSGMVARLAFACAVHSRPDVLLVDEVLAVGDMRFRAKCYRRLAELRESGVAMVLVSHNPMLILSTCDIALYLSKGSVALKGTPEEALRRYEEDQGGAHEPAMGELSIPRRGAPSDLSIRHLALKDASGRTSAMLASGEAAELWVRCEAAEPVEGFRADVLVRGVGLEGDRAFFLSSAQEGRRLSAPRGEFTIRLRLPYCGLRPGRYALKFSLMHEERFHPYDAIDSFVFGVKPDARMAGSLFFQPSSWEIAREPV